MLVSAVVVAAVGVIIPVSIGAEVGNAVGVLPFALFGSALGGLVGGLALRSTPASVGVPVMVLALFSFILVVSGVGGPWRLATNAYALATFAGSCIGSHLRYRAWSKRQPHQRGSRTGQ
ncbi:hypothetical protein ACLBWP_16935 [Microbacterium sp. M1A1_1b]